MIKTTKASRLKVMTILGTRPEIIRLSRVIPKLDTYLKHIIVYTNQNYDYDLSGVFFEELGLRKPDYLLDVKSGTLGQQIAKILVQTEEVISKERPDAILILGDTNSSLSAIVAKRMKVPIFHMEAGNRCFDWRVPEETNRRIVDHISDINLPYTEHARRYLIAEGIPQEKIYVIGSPLSEVLEYYKEKIDSSEILDILKIESKKYFLVSMHREENIDDSKNFAEILRSLNSLAINYKLPIIVSLHPRTRKKLKEVIFKPSRLIRFEKPFGFFDYNKLQKESLCVLSDSGTIQEESAVQGFSAIQIRRSSERPEAFDTGSIILVGTETTSIVNAIDMVIDLDIKGEQIIVPEDYKDKNVSSKVVKLILGMTSIMKH